MAVRRAFLSLSLAALLTGFLDPDAIAAQDPAADPNPADDDVKITMPCGGVMVFKKVYTGAGDRLSDLRFSAGSPSSRQYVSQSPHKIYVQGSFEDEQGFYYLMGKYELNEGQYALLKDYEPGVKCGAPRKASIRDRIAKGGLSWFDGIDLGRRYSLYLASEQAKLDMKTAGFAALPASGAENHVVRLPTDAEWEFAARGGKKVSSGDFNAEVFPFEEGSVGIADYAWYKGQDSASDGKIRVGGLKKPNPLGLYDILGNVTEMMFEPFRATRTGRLQGQPGGFTVRGGSVRSVKSDMLTSARSEREFLIRGRENAPADSGLRFVIGLPFSTSIDEVRKMNEQIRELGMADPQQTESADGSTVDVLDSLLAKQKEREKEQKSALESAERENRRLEQDKEEMRLAMERLEKERETVDEARGSLQQDKESLQEDNRKLLESNEKLLKDNARLLKSMEELRDDNERLKSSMSEAGGSMKELTGGLKDLREKMIRANADRDEMRDRAVRSALRLGGYLCTSIAREQGTYERVIKIENMLKDIQLPECGEDPDSESCAAATEKQNRKLEANRELAKQTVDFFVSYYADHINDTLDTFEIRNIRDMTKQVVREGLNLPGILNDYIRRFSQDVEDYSSGDRDMKKNKERWLRQCSQLRKGAGGRQ